jgi:hypothetical protein
VFYREMFHGRWIALTWFSSLVFAGALATAFLIRSGSAFDRSRKPRR